MEEERRLRLTSTPGRPLADADASAFPHPPVLDETGEKRHQAAHAVTCDEVAWSHVAFPQLAASLTAT